VDVGGRIRFVETRQIDYVEAEQNYVRLHLPDRSYLIRRTLTEVEATLGPTEFLRVHRSLLVQLDRVCEVAPLVHGEYALTLEGGRVLVSGRRYRERVRVALGLARRKPAPRPMAASMDPRARAAPDR
jgi:two-component system LytT family response regulator